LCPIVPAFLRADAFAVILPGTSAAEIMPAVEVEKRAASFNARRALLRSNPALFVSRTRLSVRQLPLFVTARGLKRLALHAVRAFEDEVRAGTRAALTPDELVPDERDAGGEPGAEGASKKRRAPGRATAVRQAKVVAQGDRVDGATGLPRSKGYGFVELHAHAHALRFLRWANGNPAVGPLLSEWWAAEAADLAAAEEKKPKEQRDDERVKRLREEAQRKERKGRGDLIVEFSIENSQVVQRRAAKTQEARDAVRPLPRYVRYTAI
jgi:nucleolar protein 4